MNRWPFTLLCLVALVTAACEQKKPAPTAHDESAQPLSKMDAAPAGPQANDPYADPYASSPPARPSDAAMAKPSDPGMTEASPPKATGKVGQQRTHTVQRGDTLYKLARQYYSDQGQWKKIYDANRSVIRDKDRLEPGMRLVIP
jgi:nucleoid-associated protein YgaU